MIIENTHKVSMVKLNKETLQFEAHEGPRVT